eukprot:gene18014-biopygen4733
MLLAVPPKDDVLTGHLDNFHKNVATPYICDVWRDIEIRFGCSGLIAAVQIFDPKHMPLPDSPDFANYGDKDLRTILFGSESGDWVGYGKEACKSVVVDKKTKEMKKGPTMQPMVDASKCLASWIDFRRMMSEGKRDKHFDDVQSFLKYFFSNSLDELYPELSDLLIISAVLPVGSCSQAPATSGERWEGIGEPSEDVGKTSGSQCAPRLLGSSKRWKTSAKFRNGLGLCLASDPEGERQATVNGRDTSEWTSEERRETSGNAGGGFLGDPCRRLAVRLNEWLMLASVEGPDWRDKDVKDLTDEQAVQIIRMFAAIRERRIPM